MACEHIHNPGKDREDRRPSGDRALRRASTKDVADRPKARIRVELDAQVELMPADRSVVNRGDSIFLLTEVNAEISSAFGLCELFFFCIRRLHKYLQSNYLRRFMRNTIFVAVQCKNGAKFNTYVSDE